MGGGGQYGIIARDCDGNAYQREKSSFKEVSVSFDHKPTRNLRFGLRTHYIFGLSDYEGPIKPPYGTFNRILIVNPFVNFESEFIAFGIGPLFQTNALPERGAIGGNGRFKGASKKPISVFVRAGSSPRYFTFSFLHAAPIFSNGYFQFGRAFETKKVNAWVGTGVGPYDHLGLLVKLNLQLQPSLYLNTITRIGQSAGVGEYAFGLGLTYRLRKRK